jgi:hypothetical protein
MRSLLYRAFHAVQGWLLGVIAVFLAIWFAPEGTVSLRVFFGIVAVGVLIVTILAQAVRILFSEKGGTLPTLITVQTVNAPGVQPAQATVLLLQPSELFAHESYVAIYRYTHSFERLIGLGYVLTIQQDRRIQVLVTSFVEPTDGETWQELLANNANTMQQIIVKPHLPKAYAEQV